MQRDMDLIRLLLLEKEGAKSIDLSKYSMDQKNYHLALLIEADLLQGKVHYPSTKHTDIPDKVFVKRITWNGHEFLDKARNDTVWNKAKEIIKNKGASISIQAITIALEKAIALVMA